MRKAASCGVEEGTRLVNDDNLACPFFAPAHSARASPITMDGELRAAEEKTPVAALAQFEAFIAERLVPDLHLILQGINTIETEIEN